MPAPVLLPVGLLIAVASLLSDEHPARPDAPPTIASTRPRWPRRREGGHVRCVILMRTSPGLGKRCAARPTKIEMKDFVVGCIKRIRRGLGIGRAQIPRNRDFSTP